MLLPIIKKILDENKQYKIAFFGDSITSTEWVHPNWREIIEYVLKEELMKQFSDWKIPSWHIRCINAGFDGSTTQDWLHLVDTEIITYQPNLVILLGGGNDVYFGISAQQHKQNLELLIQKVVAQNSHFVLCTSIPDLTGHIKNRYENYAKEAMKIEKQEGLQIIDLHSLYKQFPLEKLFTFISNGNEVVGIKPGDIDPCHPNQLGNAYIAKVILAECFEISFDPEKYSAETKAGKMYPGY